MKKRFSDEQIIGFLREGDTAFVVKELFRRHGFSETSYHQWRSKFVGMSVSDGQALRGIEIETMRPRKLQAESLFENKVAFKTMRKKS